MLLEPTLNEMSKNGCNFSFKKVSTITDMSDINFSRTHFAHPRPAKAGLGFASLGLNKAYFIKWSFG